MKYFLDSEFIENGTTIDLISLALVAEDSRSLYLQNKDCVFGNASDWVWRNVFPSLGHFNLSGKRSCSEPSRTMSAERLTGKCNAPDCPWRYKFEIRDEVRLFCDQDKHGAPEFWGYYADYDWVAFCQLFGTMMELPKGYPMYCRDVKQLADSLGVTELPPQPATEHNALSDAIWNKIAYNALTKK